MFLSLVYVSEGSAASGRERDVHTHELFSCVWRRIAMEVAEHLLERGTEQGRP